MLAIDITLCCMTLADDISNEKIYSVGEVNLSAPPLEVTGACFAFGILAKLVGGWGVYVQRIRHVSVFIAVNLLLAISESSILVPVTTRANFICCLIGLTY